MSTVYTGDSSIDSLQTLLNMAGKLGGVVWALLLL